MRFKTSITNINTFTKLTSSLLPLSNQAWLRLTPDTALFIVHDTTTSVWAHLTVPTLFTDYRISSANNNIINLELPLPALHRALRSCAAAVDAVLRLTKRAADNAPILCLSITTSAPGGVGHVLVTQEIPVRVLSAASADVYKEPRAPDADVNIFLPSLAGMKGVAERFLKVVQAEGGEGRILLAANGRGEFRMRVEVLGVVKVESVWRELQNPVLEGAEEGSTAATADGSWKEVRVDGKEWCRVLRVSALARRAVACITSGSSLVLYVFLTEEGDPDLTVVTVSTGRGDLGVGLIGAQYYMSAFSA